MNFFGKSLLIFNSKSYFKIKTIYSSHTKRKCFWSEVCNETQLSSFSVYWVLLAGLAHVVSLHIFSRALHHDVLKLCHKFLISEIYMCRLFIYHQSPAGVSPSKRPRSLQVSSSSWFSGAPPALLTSSNCPPTPLYSFSQIPRFTDPTLLLFSSSSHVHSYLSLCVILLFVLFYSPSGIISSCHWGASLVPFTGAESGIIF